MRIVICGTGAFAVPTSRWLASSEHEVVMVVTRPIADSGKRRKTSDNPVRDFAESVGLPIESPANINDPEFVERLAQCRPDVLFVCDYGQLLSAECLRAARLGGINLHGSLLPRHRGAAPVQWAILKGDTETGVSVIHMTPRLDAGPVLAERRTTIGQDETAEELEPRLAELGVAAVRESLELLDAWDGESPIGTSQDPAQATRAPRLKKKDGHVDWNMPAAHIRNQIRALQPWPGTFTEWRRRDDKPPVRLILKSADAVDDDSADDILPGTIVRAAGDELVVKTGQGCLAVRRIQPAGKREMEVGEFLRGYHPRPGDRFGAAESA